MPPDAAESNRCLTSPEAEALAQGRLAVSEAASAEAHLVGCATCRNLVARMEGIAQTRDDALLQSALPTVSVPRHPVEEEVKRGDSIGRYLVLHRIGAGGMGLVISAFDPELDRKVAIKL